MQNINLKEKTAEIERTNPAPAFQFYPKDFLSDPNIAALNLEEFGFFMRLICYIWLDENLVFDEKKLAKLLHVTPKKFQKLFAPVSSIFEISDGIIKHLGLEELRRKQAEWRLKSSIGGQKSAEARRKGGSSLVSTKEIPNSNTSSTSSSPPAFASSSSNKKMSLSASADSSLSSFFSEKDDVAIQNIRAKGDEITEVFNYWRIKNNSKRELTKHFRRKIEQRIAEGCSVDILKSAVDGFAKLDLPQHQNTIVHCNFSTIFQSKSSVEYFAKA